jgi:hypothetical protein
MRVCLQSRTSKLLLLASIGLALLSPLGALAAMPTPPPVPPQTIAGFQPSAAPRTITAANIFEYMNGGGELYLAYRFDHLTVYEYAGADDQRITAEVYAMQSTEDAFGLLSLDWGGDPVDLGATKPSPVATSKRVPGVTALYGAGLLRIWQGRYFIRILAYTETAASKAAVLEMGRSLSMPTRPRYPSLLGRLPLETDAGWRLRKDRVGFLRSHLVLNSLFYLSHDNLLDLDHSVDAVFVPYEWQASGQAARLLHLLLIQYPSPVRAQAARSQFMAAYLPEHIPRTASAKATEASSEEGRFVVIEDGCLGIRQWQGLLGIVFGAPNCQGARHLLDHIAAPTAAQGG